MIFFSRSGSNTGTLCDAFQTFLSLCVFFLLHFGILTSLSLHDRSQQLFGPCLFSSAYQHALVPAINIGECQFSGRFFSSRSSHHVIPYSCINRILSTKIEMPNFPFPFIAMLTDYHSSQGPVFYCSIPAAAAACSLDRGAHYISSAIRRPWRQKLNSKKRLHSATQRLMV